MENVAERLRELVGEVDVDVETRRKFESVFAEVEALTQQEDRESGDSTVRAIKSDTGFEDVHLPTIAGRGATVDSQRFGFDAPDTKPRPQTTGLWEESTLVMEFQLPDGYEHERFVVQGGMGEIHFVTDTRLNRTAAMKVLRSDRADNRMAIRRFVEEAQVTAQLDHPTIPPVYDFGRLPDGRLYFTMKMLGEMTLSETIAEVHGEFEGDFVQQQWGEWSVRKLLDALLRVCEALEYAHRCDVIHRDIKPANITVGDCGEVHLIDWGIARCLNRPQVAMERPSPQEIETDRGDSDVRLTRDGSIVGTAAYMAPEQVRGENDRVGPAADVFSIGTILYEILGGEPAFPGKSHLDVMMRVLDGPEVPAVELPDVPRELGRICDKAMAQEPEDRFGDAGALRRRLSDWLEGRRQREKASVLVGKAGQLEETIRNLRERRDAVREEARVARQSTPPHAPIEQKRDIWEQEDRLEALEQAVAEQESEQLGLLRRALNCAPDFDEAHALVAEVYRRRHRRAERHGDHREAVMYERRLREHDIGGVHESYLSGRGWLTLRTQPEGVRAKLFRYREHQQRLTPEFDRVLGETPFIAEELSIGQYLVQLEHPGHATVRYPVEIRREKHWGLEEDDGGKRRPIRIPSADELADDACFVPGGPFLSGSRVPGSKTLRERRVWVDSFVIQRDPVTQEQYLAFLNDLVDQGRGEEAERLAPRSYGGVRRQTGSVAYGRRSDGTFTLDSEDSGEWQPDWPVFLVDWFGARAYARWYARQTGRPWRLPSELEWEKAARGVDGRQYPWGDHFEPNFCCMSDSSEGTPRPAPVGAFSEDESPYGVRGMGGNVFEWCLDAFSTTGRVEDGRAHIDASVEEDHDAHRVLRGGAWLSEAHGCTTYHRDGLPARSRLTTLGFRLVAPFPFDG